MRQYLMWTNPPEKKKKSREEKFHYMKMKYMALLQRVRKGSERERELN